MLTLLVQELTEPTLLAGSTHVSPTETHTAIRSTRICLSSLSEIIDAIGARQTHVSLCQALFLKIPLGSSVFNTNTHSPLS